MTDGVLLVGYGNAMRSDDGLGWHAAERLAEDQRLAGSVVLQRQQLTPELALDISESALVVLIDASTALAPGVFSVTMVEPAADVLDRTWSHHVSPTTLVAIARELYGRACEVYVVSCGVQSLDIGDRLSPVVEQALPQMVDAIAELVVLRAVLPEGLDEEGRIL